MPVIPFNQLVALASDYLRRAGCGAEMADSTARALVAAEAAGMPSHGLSRLPQYAAHLRHGRVDGLARPCLKGDRPAALLVDAADGFAFPACDLAVRTAIDRARQYGVAWVGVFNSHHSGVLSHHLHDVGTAGMVGLAFSNSPAAMPAWGGRRPIFGTNPIAAIFPRRNELSLIVDLSLSEVARGKLMVAAREGRSIPEGWALDAEGQPTTDPQKGLAGMMLPMGGVKGSMLALVVELLCCALTGASFGFEADSFFTETGNRPRIGQAFLVIDPDALGGGDLFSQRIETLLSALLVDEGVRLPGSRRFELLQSAIDQGLEVSATTLAELAT
ncbi:MAG: Ldh family oxidoreductase [Acidobacteriota bacterium]